MLLVFHGGGELGEAGLGGELGEGEGILGYKDQRIKHYLYYFNWETVRSNIYATL